MSVSLLRFDLASIAAALEDPTRIGELPVVDGGLPPRFILDNAATALLAGGPPVWCAPYAFVDDDTRRVVGGGGFKGLPADGSIELGYNVAPSLRGRGFATAGVNAMVALALGERHIGCVVAETAVDNVASRRVVEKAGFVHAGRRMTDDDGLVDCWRRDASR